MAQFVNIYDVDLMKPSAPRQLKQMVCEGDSKGNRIGANVYSDGSPVALGGQCVGKVVRADGTTVQLTGTISGNQAYVVLDQASCAIEGPMQVAVCWVSGTNITTLVVAYGAVINTQTGTAVQPSTPVPDLTQLLAEIDNMRQATAAANAAAEGALANFAPAFSESIAYTAGQYVTYTDGKLYQFIADHAAGAWNSAQVYAVTVGDEAEALTATVNTISELGENLFDAASATDGSRLDGSGNVITNAPAYYISDFISIAGGYPYIKNQPAEDAQHRIAYFQTLNGPVLGVYSANITVAPAGAAYARISGLLAEKTGLAFGLASAKDLVARNDMSSFETMTNDAITSLSEINEGVNLCDNSANESGFVNYATGQITSHATYYHTDYIPVKRGVIYGIWGAQVLHFAMYDIQKKYIANSINNYKTVLNTTTLNYWSYFTAQFDGYLRFTVANATQKCNFIIAESSAWFSNHVYNGTYPYSDRSVVPYGISGVRHQITINSGDGITGFYEKMMNAFEIGNCDVEIEQGTYTYTNELVDSIRAAGKRGVPIGKGCRYYFNGAHIYCEYAGANAADVVDLFSPLDSWNVATDFEIYNLDLVSKNTCYALHDEGNGGDFCRHIYRDCYIELDNTALGANGGNAISKALGGGLAAYEEVIIEDCVFKATNPAKTTTHQNDASYHGANGSTFTDAKLIVTGCWFENIFRCSNLSVNTEAPYPSIIYTNCSSGAVADLPTQTWSVRSWNNEVRS